MAILNTDGTKPIYMQIAEWLETEIMNGHFQTDEKVYSQYQLAEMYTINPATAAKGLNLLADENILYKKRGLGMFVSENAKERIIQKRKNQTLKRLIEEVVLEARRLKIGETELIDMIKASQSGGERHEGY
ncbi:GntR family transcriptional regulator [Niallia oryzisoli]|uniref:GntR family transcriptional regulator n=1 Tax=Niallia oryzisoli TaxID=1737571 RepID=UPI003736F090